jgi:shikimate kinase
MVNGAAPKPTDVALEARILRALGGRSIVLVGMMGAGKSSIGRRLAGRLGIPFVDADTEIESAAGMTIPEIFAKHGEPYFRAGEARVIARLLEQGPQVLATGGGAVMDARTRALIRDKGVSVWLKELMPAREPVYAQSDITVQSRDEPHDVIVDEIIAAMPDRLAAVEEEGTS